MVDQGKRIQLLGILIVLCPVIFGEIFKTIQTRLGSAKGVLETRGMDKVYQFRRIPYAKPPIGHLRFSKPESYGPWVKTLDATQYPPSCVQFKNQLFSILLNQEISEDCLFLNIHIPREINVSNPKSVMVWIHGGGYETGQASAYDGTNFALIGDVIVVSINYRLGVFGFISSGDSILPGNYGLWDQRMAIQWVKDNIVDFGGNPSSITIFGESAGGFSVSIHAISPINQGLFQRVIVQSGTALSKLSLSKTNNLISFGRLLDCFNDTVSNSTNVAECLRQKSTEELLNASRAFVYSGDNGRTLSVKLGAVIDGELLIADPVDLLSNTKSSSYKFFRSLDIIVGTTNGEGSLLSYVMDYLKIDIKDGITTSVLCDIFSPAIAKEFYNGIFTISTAVCDKYKVQNGDSSMKNEQGRAIVNMYGDLFFVAPAVELLDIHSYNNEQSKTYQYSFENELVSITPMPSWYHGAQHGAELVFLFNLELWSLVTGISISAGHRKLSQDMLKYWTNFAKTGDPNSYNSSNNSTSLVSWPIYEYQQKNYIQLNVDIQQQSRLLTDRMTFWLSVVPGILNPVIKTNSGLVRGMAIQYPMGTISHFRGIPYAKPPMGNLRFIKSEPVDRWNITLDTTQYKSSCMHMLSDSLSKMSEDCLFLNIYVPGGISSSNKMAVMIWIHGGVYTRSKGDNYDGSILALKGNVIVVTLGYRSGVFGFLTSGDSKFKGNYGLWDQRLAIEWVKNNILGFGGNPSAITIFGHSVLLQAVSPLNAGLFQRVIEQSGIVFSPFAFSKTPQNLAIHFANALNCNNASFTTISECLRSKQAKDILASTSNINLQPTGSEIRFEQPFTPTVDGELIPSDPFELLSDTSSASYKVIKSVDIMSGINSGEGSVGISILDSIHEHFNLSINKGVSQSFMCEHWAPTITSTLNFDTLLSTRLCNEYKMNIINRNTSLEQYGRQTLKMFSDGFFASTIIQFLNLHSRNNYQSSTYQYLFSRESLRWLIKPSLPLWFEGSSYGGEIGYVFGTLERSLGEPDRQLSDKMMKYWSNFAESGDPNGKNLPRWSEFGYSNSKVFLDFGSDAMIRQKKMLWSDRMKLWFELKGVTYLEDIEKATGHATSDKQFKGISLLMMSSIFVLISH